MTDGEVPEFLFVTCQVGAEATLKRELAKYRPSFRFAFSRPGFLTFKLPPNHRLTIDFDLKAIFARSHGFSLGKVDVGADPAAAAEQVWRMAGDRPITALHVWPRDRHAPGEHGYEVGLTPESRAVEELLRSKVPERLAALRSKEPTKTGDLVLDVIVLEPNAWWLGVHGADDLTTRRPGGIFDEIELPYEAVSRAYLKMEEALRWSRLPVKPGDAAAEIGCAPGGSCQALLRRQMSVMGIDPAEMHPAVLDHPNFAHIRKRGAEVRKRQFAGVRWLMTDMNVAPTYTLDTVEAIVTHEDVDIEGMILTLKLLDWAQADAVEDYRARIQSWGYTKIQMRQLQHNRREFTVAAIR